MYGNSSSQTENPQQQGKEYQFSIRTDPFCISSNIVLYIAI